MVKTISQNSGYQPAPPPPSPPQPSIDTNILINALTKIKRASSLQIIACLLNIIGSIVVSMISMDASPGTKADGVESESGLNLDILIAPMVVGLTAEILALLATIGKLVPGSRLLATVEQKFSTASALISTGYELGLIMSIFGILMLIIFFEIRNLYSLVLANTLISMSKIFLITGGIGMFLLCFKLNKRFKNALFLVAGILLIVGNLIQLFSFIAWILLYVTLGGAIESLRAQPQAPHQPPPI